MPRIGAPKAAFRDPADSETTLVRLEIAADCDGLECNLGVHNERGELEALPVHGHIVESGKEPDAGPRCVGVIFELP